MASSPRKGGTREGASAAALTFAGMADLLPALPLETRCPPFALRQYGGFWLPEAALRRGIPALYAGYVPRPDDVLLASFPKSGTTWLKALAFATAHRAAHPPSSDDHPLRRTNPHDLVRSLEIGGALVGRAENDMDDAVAELEALPSPRVLATHLPHSLLPPRVAVGGSSPRIVYICRDPKDALVSSWLFTRVASASVGVDTAESFSLREALELFVEGRCFYGPQWRHVVEYWEASRRTGANVLFLWYEEMLRDPAENLKTMAEFMGCGFSEEEIAGGVVDEIVELCSLEKLRNMEANRSGRRNASGIRSDAFFRKGVAGDWSSHMSPEMGSLVDHAVEDALKGYGFSFASVTAGSE